VRGVSGLACDSLCHGAQHHVGNGMESDLELLVSLVGALVELLVDSSEPSARAAEGSGSSAPPYAALAGGAAALLIAITATGWYAARRRLS